MSGVWRPAKPIRICRSEFLPSLLYATCGAEVIAFGRQLRLGKVGRIFGSRKFSALEWGARADLIARIDRLQVGPVDW